MNKTKIDWADYSWNPVTGCLHGCEYCYARGIAKRFGGHDVGGLYNGEYEQMVSVAETGELHDVGLAFPLTDSNGRTRPAPYPYMFDPTFHRWRLVEPQKITKPQNIFVCSMADLFGDWVPDSWIGEVFKACEDAPQHRYLFLTKNPKRYERLEAKNRLPIGRTHFYGSTVTSLISPMFTSNYLNTFVSIEPMMQSFGQCGIFDGIDWVIIGAETGNRKDRVVPEREWIENIVEKCWQQKKPVFLKNSLADIWGEPLIQEYPWEDRKAVTQ